MLDPATPYGDVTFVDLPEIRLVVVRYPQVTLEELRPLFHRAMGPLGEAMSAGRLRPDGPFLAVYRGDVEAAFDVDIGFPAREPVEDGAVTTVLLPAGSAAVLSALGSYDGLGAAWGRVVDAVAAAGRTLRGEMVEVYVGDPSHTPMDEVRTDLIALLV